MLTELTVKNLALIESLVINFGSGANIMTGETGAGKSILVGALGLLMGRRGTADLVRAGAEEAGVTALFHPDRPETFLSLINEMGLEEAATDELILKRVITAAGRSRCYVNGQPVTLTQLTVFGETLLCISGQHDQQSLLKPGHQLDFLDRFAGHQNLLDNMRLDWQALGRTAAELNTLEGRLKDAEEKRDLYEFQRDEIAKVAPKPGEDDELLAEKNLAKHSGRLLECLGEAARILGNESGNVVEKLGRVRRNLEKAVEYDPRLADGFAVADDCYHQLADLAVELETLGRDMDVDPDRLEWLDERLNTLAKLKRKYNLSLAELIERGRHIAEMLDQLDGAGLDLARLRREKTAAEKKARETAAELHNARSRAGVELAGRLTEILRGLGFPKLEMRVEVESQTEDGGETAEKRLGPTGFDRVNFLFCPNPGEGLKPLAKIASGGELSRVMLALKTVQDRPGDQLMVFDEIDAGLGGITAEAVAAKMADLARRQQVVIITHLPQMAALTGRHFVVAKQADDKAARTLTSITALELEQRVDELARMLGGASPSPQALALAQEMLCGGTPQ